MKKIYLLISLISTLAISNISAQVSFTQDVFNGCANLTVNFTNTSSIDTSGGVIFIWNFGDGTIDTAFHASHTYTNAGWYNVQLTADSSGMFKGDFFGNVQVNGSSGMFESNPMGSSCPDEEVTFSTNDNYHNLDWDFGDGNTAEHNFVRHTFNDTGAYTVTMILDGMCGTDTVTQLFFVSANSFPPADIQVNSTEGCIGDNFSFSPQQNNDNYDYLWDFDDGDTSLLENDMHAFVDTGDYLVILEVTNTCGNSSYDTVEISIEQNVMANADFGVTPFMPCPNNTVEFNANGIGSFVWDFGNGDSSTMQHPMHIYTDTGSYNVSLIVTNGCGNSDTSSQVVNVQPDPNNKPFANIGFDDMSSEIDTLTICPGVEVSFRNFSGNNNNPVTYLWDFDDGDTATTENASHTFLSHGMHEVSLIIANNCLASDTAYKWVNVDSSLVPNGDNLMVFPDSLCVGENAYFFDEGDNNLENGYTYHIWFGDGDSLINITSFQDSMIDVLAIHSYDSLGSFVYTFVATNVCGNSDTIVDTVHVVNSISQPMYFVENSTQSDDPMYDASGCPGDTVEFFAVGGVSVQWDFGDPMDTTSASGNQVFHAYADTGTYNARAFVTNACGQTDTIPTEVTIGNSNTPEAYFDMGVSMVCAYDTVFFTYEGRGDDDEIDNNTYLWDFDDSTSSTLRDPFHIFTEGGNYQINLTVTNGCGSEDEDRNLTVIGLPEIDINGLDTSYCVNESPITISPLPMGGTLSGNGIIGNTFDPSAAGIGSHYIRYSFTNINGCFAEDSILVVVHPVPMANAGPDVFICAGGSAQLNATGGGTYRWFPVFWLNSDSIANPISTPLVSTTYQVQVTGPGGCIDHDLVAVFVDTSLTANAGNDTSFCAGGNVMLSGNGGGLYAWSPSTGLSDTTVSNPIASPSMTTTYIMNVSSGACNDADTIIVTVNPIPTVSITAVPPVCVDAASFALMASPSGGTFTGSGVSSNNFDPSTAGIGSHTIVYTYTDSNGCVGVDSINIVVNGLPTVSLSSLADVCILSSQFGLSGGSPAGGNYSGNGVLGNNFDPTLAGLGTHTIVYTYADTNSCSASDSSTITVNALPSVSLGAFSDVCANAASFSLSGGSPSGGTFSGPGVSAGNFDPSIAGVGTHLIGYTYTDTIGCTSSDSSNIIVNPIPTVSITAVPPVCVDAASFALMASPSGGTFTGPGVSSNNFDPSTAGIGSHTIVYTYTDSNGCVGVDSINIVVNGLPTVSLSSLADVCILSSQFGLSGGSPAGGNYSGNGVLGNNFDPTLAGLGTHTIVYTYADTNSCSASDSSTITVNALPSVSLGAFSDVCVNAASFALSGGSPAGGTFSGPGVSAGNFDPSIAGVGTHLIGYTYTDTNGCTSSDSSNITVNAIQTATLPNFSDVCITEPIFTLTGGTPTGGSYSGPGVSAGNFDPSVAGIGTHTITYVYIDSNSCIISDSATITVNGLPIVNLPNFSDVCVDSGAFLLTTGTPSGGTYSGSAVVNGHFEPLFGGPGTYTVIYTYTDSNSCSSSDSSNITVNGLPTVTLDTFPDVCVDNASFSLTGGMPAGGTYSGPGVNGGDYEPSTAGAGTHEIVYTYTDGNGCSASDTSTIVVHGLPIIEAGPDAFVCAGGSAQLNAIGGGTYKWTPTTGLTDHTIANPVASPTMTTQYTLEVTNNGGCVAFDTLTVSVGPSLTANAGNDTSFCDGENVMLNGRGGGLYAWSPSTGLSDTTISNPIASPLMTTTYVMTVSSGACSDSDTITVTVNPIPTVTIVAVPPACVNNASFTLMATPGGGTFSGPGISGNDFDPAVAGVGTHTIIYTYLDMNSCKGIDSISIVVNGLPSINFVDLLDVCLDNASFALTGATPAGGNYSGIGVNANNFDPSVAGAGTHTIVYTYADTNGCTSSDSANITVNALPTVSLMAFPDVCIDASSFPLTGGTPSGGNYTGPGVSGGNFDPSIAGVGTHTIVYTYTDTNVCTNSDSSTIVVRDLPTVDAGPDAFVCAGGSTQLMATGGGGSFYSWTPTDSLNCVPCASPIANPSVTTSYVVMLSDSSGCVGMDSVTVNVTTALIADAGNDTSICFGESANLLGTGGGIYAWTPGLDLNDSTISNPVASPTSTISYILTVSSGTCSDSDTVQVAVNSLPVATISTSGDTLTATAASTYQWFLNDTLLAGDTSQTLVANASGDYKVVITDVNGCTDTSATVNVIVGIGEVNNSHLISIQPNPSKGIFNVSFEDVNIEKAYITVYEITGKVIYQENIPVDNSSFRWQIDISKHPKGVYLLNLTVDEKNYIERIVVN